MWSILHFVKEVSRMEGDDRLEAIRILSRELFLYFDFKFGESYTTENRKPLRDVVGVS